VGRKPNRRSGSSSREPPSSSESSRTCGSWSWSPSPLQTSISCTPILGFVAAREDWSQIFLPSEELSGSPGSAKSSRPCSLVGQVTRPDLLLYRGNLEPLTVPRSWFRRRAVGGPKPDLQSICCDGISGRQFVLVITRPAADAIFVTSSTRSTARVQRKRLREEDKSLGGAIRRLRLQKGLRQSDFPGISAKEIGTNRERAR